MKTLKELRELRADTHRKAQAVIDVAQAENREMKPDEIAEVDKIFGKGKVGEADYKAGELDAIDEQISRGEKIEKRAAELAGQQAAGIYNSRKEEEKPSLLTAAVAKQRHGAVRGYANREDAFIAGAWAAAQLLGNQKAREFCNAQGMQIQNAMSGGDNGAGGFLVPEVLENAIIRLVETYGAFRANARNLAMTSDTVSIPRQTGEVTAYFVSEVPSSITASDLTIATAQLQAKVMAVRTLISNDLIEDAMVDLGNMVATSAANEFAKKEDQCGFDGDGSSTYGGIVGIKSALAAGSKKTAATGNTAFSTLDAEDFLGMIGLLPAYALANAKWYISQAGWADSIARLQNAAGGNTVADLGRGPILQYQGYPVVKVQTMNSTLTAQTSTDGLVYFGDLSLGATVGLKRGIRVAVLRELYAATRQTGLIIDQRLDINVHERGTASVAGPIVMLSTPGS